MSVECIPNDPLASIKQKVGETLINGAMNVGQIKFKAQEKAIDIAESSEDECSNHLNNIKPYADHIAEQASKNFANIKRGARQHVINKLGAIAFDAEKMNDDMEKMVDIPGTKPIGRMPVDIPGTNPHPNVPIEQLDIEPELIDLPINPDLPKSNKKNDCTPEVNVNVECKPPNIDLHFNVAGGTTINEQNIGGNTAIHAQGQMGQINAAGQMGQINAAGQMGQGNISGGLAHAKESGQSNQAIESTQTPSSVTQSLSQMKAGGVPARSITPISSVNETVPGVSQFIAPSGSVSQSESNISIHHGCNQDNRIAWIDEPCGKRVRDAYWNLWFPTIDAELSGGDYNSLMERVLG